MKHILGSDGVDFLKIYLVELECFGYLHIYTLCPTHNIYKALRKSMLQMHALKRGRLKGVHITI